MCRGESRGSPSETTAKRVAGILVALVCGRRSVRPAGRMQARLCVEDSVPFPSRSLRGLALSNPASLDRVPRPRGLSRPWLLQCLSDTRERPGPLKESLVTYSSLEGACHPWGKRQVQQKGGEGGVAQTEPLLGLPLERHAAWGTSVGSASLDNPMGFGLFGGLQVPGPCPGWCRGAEMLAWRAEAR